MVEVSVTHPDEETTRVKVALERSRDEESLGASLDALVATTDNLEKLIRNPRALSGSRRRAGSNSAKHAWNLVTTFHTPAKRFVRERRFFERCARHPALHERMLTYVRNVNARARIPGLRTDLGHSDMRPAGCFAMRVIACGARLAPAHFTSTCFTVTLSGSSGLRARVASAVAMHCAAGDSAAAACSAGGFA
jgi:hypothetical protein